jgi:L-fuculose-phosphate aldolase
MTIQLRQQLIDTAVAMNASGLNQGASGNLSVRDGKGFLITPSGMDYAGLSTNDIVWMDFDGHTQGTRNPSSEWRFHAAIYRHRAEAKAVLHAHPVSCSALACLGMDIPAFHYMVAIAGGNNIRCAHYATFGTPELSDNVIKALIDRKACLMAHHGLTCFEKDLPRALALAIEVEHLATVYGRILAIGEVDILSDSEMEKVLKKFSRYGLQGTELTG